MSRDGGESLRRDLRRLSDVSEQDSAGFLVSPSIKTLRDDEQDGQIGSLDAEENRKGRHQAGAQTARGIPL